MRKLFSRTKATVYYGPWQCTDLWVADCKKQCAGQGYELRGCMWLADVKMDGEGHEPIWRLDFKAGGRYAVTHCCCSYPKISTEETDQRRKKWNRHRSTFQMQWEEAMGEWPTDPEGKPYDTHHIRDLEDGGDPTARENLLPVPSSMHHKVLDREYPVCYGGQGRWAQIGIRRPYLD
ncbi:MAG TPA: hypothetical protein VH877_33465 [Polyangia bacterium]|nr:hypothetical protein [Polyangia bacterium]